MRSGLLPFSLLIPLLACATLAQAHNDHDHGHENDHDHEHHHSHDHDSLGAHVHGEAHLEAAFSGQEIELLLSSPAVNLIGFEHAPRNEDQQQTLDDALSYLTDNAVVEVDGIRCELTTSEVSTPLTDADFDGSHGDIEVEQQLRCDQPLAGTRVHVRVLEHFTDIESLRVTWLSDRSQGSLDLSPAATGFAID